MKDRENNQLAGRQLPPNWCSSLCRNAMNEVCVEHCAVKRDCSGFEPKPNLNLQDMPPFPETNGMSREEKFTSVTIYLSKVVDQLKGFEVETYLPPFRHSITALNISTRRTIAEVGAGLQALQNDIADVQVDKKSTKAGSSTQTDSESIPSKEHE